MAVEVIEHLSKVNALQALKEFERVTREAIFLTTPVGYHKKTPADGNPYQTHLSGWSAGEFKKLGFKVRFLPDMSNKLWLFIPFALTYLTGIMAKTLVCFKKFA